MPRVLNNVIATAIADPKNHTVTLTWANGVKTVHSFAKFVGKGVFVPFAEPAFFARVRVGEAGRSLEWPGELDFCADALWFQHYPADAPELSGQAVEDEADALHH